MRGFGLFLAALASVAVVACSGANGDGRGYVPPDDVSTAVDMPTTRACVPGASQSCPCPGGGAPGVQVCTDDGLRFGACSGCQTAPPPDVPCARNCAGRACGDDGCGGQCGTCGRGQMCSGGACVAGPDACVPLCSGRACGPDSCGGSCGDCGGGGTCNAMTGQCCARQCAGRACGPDGCGGLCGNCGSGTTCNVSTGACQTVCVPSCAGRSCGDNGCGGSCGTCSGGQSCNASGVCQSACFARTGDACLTDSDCCAEAGGARTRCVRLTGVGTVCTAVCTSGAGCASGCCVSLTDGTRACNIPLFCANTSACIAGAGQRCARDADCCRESSGMFNPTACTCFGSDCTCAALCSQNSDCTSGCCARRDDGVRICARASACGG